MMRQLIVLLFLILVALSSCVERFRPNIDKYDKLLVVDGGISNNCGPYIVRLSWSSPLFYTELEMVSGGQVIISDDAGNDETLTEIEAGIYQTDTMGMQGVIGRQYKLSIHLEDGSIYETDFEELKQPIELDTVYAEIEYRKVDDFDDELAGYQFYLDTKPATSDSNFLLWNLEATYHYQSDYTIRWIWEGTLEWFIDNWKYYNCWIDDNISDIFVLNTAGISSSSVIGFPLHYVNTETRKLSVRYSLLVKQLTISEQTYNFFKGLKDNTNQGSLYDGQPSQIRGNVYNVSNPDEQVLGYFLVAGQQEKRIFVDRMKYPVIYNYYTCELNEGDFDDYEDLLWLGWHEIPVYVIETPGGRRAVPNQTCVDCRRKGGTVEKPDFWID